ncbi:MAG: hypothetical protein JNK05_08930 [Myxococcales bacterium]|nr:hypothetical protein [Myxococcales bacterium]
MSLGIAALCGCRFPPTQVEVTIDSNAPAERVLSLTATVSRGNEPNASARVYRWTRGPSGISLPSSFTVVPADGRPRDELVTLAVEATLEPRNASDPAVRFRRLARWRFQPQVPSRLRLFLPVECGARAVGCTSATADACTVARLCEERGQTCGDDGTCVVPEVVPTPSTEDVTVDRTSRDASNDSGIDTGVDATSAPDSGTDSGVDTGIDSGTDSGTDARSDTGIDARTDSGVDARSDTGVDTGIDAPTGAPFNAPCTNNTQCQSRLCVIDTTGRGVCSVMCGGALPPCAMGYRCIASGRCTPEPDCISAFTWTNPYGDGSLRLSAMQRIGVPPTPAVTFTRACVRDSARIDMCALGGLIDLTGASASVIDGRGIGPSIPGQLALTLRAAGPVHALLDNTTGAVTINIDAPGQEVSLRLTGTNEFRFIGTNRAQLIYIDTMGTVVNDGTLTGPIRIIRSSGGFMNRGTIMGSILFGGTAPTPPACP